MQYFFVGWFYGIGFPLILAFISLMKKAFRHSIDIPID